MAGLVPAIHGFLPSLVMAALVPAIHVFSPTEGSLPTARPKHPHWVTTSPALPLRQIKQTRQFWVTAAMATHRL
jgi:hypothetical protein